MADDVVRIVTVVNWARGSVHGSTRSDEQAQDWVRRLAAANPGVLLAASQTVDTIDVSAEVAAAESRGRAAGYAEAVQALADHDVQIAVALAICRQRLPWTRTVPKPIIDPENYAAFMAEAQILLAAASTAVELIASRATTEETPR